MRAEPKAASVSRSESSGCKRPASVPARYGFSKRSHLRKTDEISSVFDFRRRHSGATLTVLVKPNALGFSRLAVMVARKVSRRAVARNYMRRVVREVFRQHQHEIGAFDLVVRVNRSFDREQHVAVREELIQHLARLSKCPDSSSTSSAPTNT